MARIPFNAPSRHDMPDVAEMLRDSLLAIVTPRKQPNLVYPFYLAARVYRTLKEADPEAIIASVGEIQTVGNGTYRVPVTDTAGTKYRITVEVLP